MFRVQGLGSRVEGLGFGVEHSPQQSALGGRRGARSTARRLRDSARPVRAINQLLVGRVSVCQFAGLPV